MRSAKQKLYVENPYPGQLWFHPLVRDQGSVAGIWCRVGKSGRSGISHGKCVDHLHVHVISHPVIIHMYVLVMCVVPPILGVHDQCQFC